MIKVKIKAKEKIARKNGHKRNNFHKPSIRLLGWTKEDAFEARARLISFEDDWNAPGMEAYDEI